ncbi:universal stress protein [Streptomyces sp. NPDC047024]|uniref:universal stress protein n=1 Tax=Streptomyces sp. NPDC047024 TaxID=3155476 RepID=UPI0033E52232
MSRPGDPRPVVVGIDTESEHRMALAWAADEAARRHVPLRPVLAEGVPTRGDRERKVPPSWEEWNDPLHEEGERVLADAAGFATAHHPRLEVDALLAEGDPVWVLGEQSHDATAVVLGSRHLSRAQEVFGNESVAVPLMAQAHCPVVVVPEPEHVTQVPAYLVVGIDGGEQSAAAVDVAFEEAALRGAELHVLLVWQPTALRVFDEHGSRQECRRMLSEIVAGHGERYPDVVLRHELVVGEPVKVLTEAAAHALALVVGTRGHGSVAGALLGSVSQGVLRQARCPVIVVPAAAA